MSGSVHTKDFLTTATWVLMIAGAVLSIVGYARLGESYYSCSPNRVCVTIEYPFDLAAIYAGLLLVSGGFAGFAIILRDSRRRQRNDSSTGRRPSSFSTHKS